MIRALEQFIRDYPDYRDLQVVYSELMVFASAGTVPEPDKVLAFADEALAKYPNDVNLRRNTMIAKIRVLKAQKQAPAGFARRTRRRSNHSRSKRWTAKRSRSTHSMPKRFS